ncbi:energy-coupling factor transporter transmembrane component T [Globicatella sp. PHS-GS-PNBC-21-1553]|uniref:energy-coupling factor transporter transmembrane component T family protein n=1 Tax=Globicatella sp. PHS-GS-PNBC-21-1553 TaxID=2885764 RepID=UPI00298F1011|nr:energy-coupling factor transporter transmembrane component T [Globicatella sp. PHS-GS-PNBC-21-1553]WPC07881.1 energy-coupling factor transporter transmembrane protein EcfT [Globicatella sp. PHS-GS-PNBC-21-1553]
MNQQFLIKYHIGDRFFDQLTGRTKVILFLTSILTMMVSFDIRFIMPFFLIHLVIFISVYEHTPGLKGIIQFVIVMNLINILLYYLVNPVIGTDLARRTTVLFKFNDYFVITYETIIYILARLMKIFGTLFISLWFIAIITPSQLAAGLNGIGVPYKICTMISLGLRYLPDVYRDFVAIKESMQMRGLELDAKKANLMHRIKSNVQILLPLLLVSFERVEIIASAMDLRGYGHGKKRSYYSDIDPTTKDTWVTTFALFQLVVFVVYLIALVMGKVPAVWVW